MQLAVVGKLKLKTRRYLSGRRTVMQIVAPVAGQIGIDERKKLYKLIKSGEAAIPFVKERF